MSALSWEELGGLAVARQFPTACSAADIEPTPELVAAWLRSTGPIQSQTARSSFIGLAARHPGVTHAALTAAFEANAVVRGSLLRGTVHTTTSDEHPVLHTVTRMGQRTLWQRTIKPHRVTLEQVWDSIEEFAADAWRTPAELSAHLSRWLTEHESAECAARLDNPAGRYFAFGHGGLVRRPLKGGWDGQGAPGYRTASAVAPPGSSGPTLRSPDEAVDAAVRLHLRAHGPASRQDLAWWSGLGLTVVDASLERLAGELTSATGPDGRTYVDLAVTKAGRPRDAAGPGDGATPCSGAASGIRLLPEFDALLCAYEPSARARFVTPEHHRALWNPDNGMLLAPVFKSGRIVGHWRLVGKGARRDLDVRWFRGTGRIGRRALDEGVATLSRALDLTIGEVEIGVAS